ELASAVLKGRLLAALIGKVLAPSLVHAPLEADRLLDCRSRRAHENSSINDHTSWAASQSVVTVLKIQGDFHSSGGRRGVACGRRIDGTNMDKSPRVTQRTVYGTDVDKS